MNFAQKIFLISTLTLSAQAKLACAPGELEVAGKRLTPYWAKEYTGSDLAAEFLDTLKERVKLEKVPTAVFDLGFESDYITLERTIPVPHQLNGRRRMRAHHGTSIVNLLTGPYRMTNYADIMSLEAIHFNGYYKYIFQKFERNNSYPKVISNSLGWRSESTPLNAQLAYDKGISWFLASGNDFPTPVKELERNSQAMLVGSYAPSGLTSVNTQTHSDLLILAPANEELKSLDGYGREALFGETSGATPLVAATAIDMLTLIPNLTPDMIATIIRDTALPSIENKLGLDSMPGLLNHYGSVITTFNLKENCQEDIECMKSILYNGEMAPAKSLSIIKCERFKKLSCKDNSLLVENLLKVMRIGVLLGHSEHRSRQAKELSCAYKTLGFTKNAEYYKTLANDRPPLEQMEIEAKKAIDENIYRRSYYRYGAFYSDEYRNYIQKSHLNEYHKKWHLDLTKEHIEGIDFLVP